MERIEVITSVERRRHYSRAEKERLVLAAEPDARVADSEIGKANNYCLNRRASFARFLDDGRICLSNNAAERALRGIAIGRGVWKFAGSGEGGRPRRRKRKPRRNHRCLTNPTFLPDLARRLWSDDYGWSQGGEAKKGCRFSCERTAPCLPCRSLYSGRLQQGPQSRSRRRYVSCHEIQPVLRVWCGR